MLPIIVGNDIEKLSGQKGLKEGITRNPNTGDAVMFYAGSEGHPKYLMEVDTLVGKEFVGEFKERDATLSYYETLPWDITRAGFVDIRVSEEVISRAYFTDHKPTEFNGTRVWFRKILASLPNGVIMPVWERYERD